MNLPGNDAAASRVERWFSRRTPWQRRGLAFVAGALATLAHAPLQIAPFYIVAIVVLIWLLDGVAASATKFRSAFLIGWLFGLGHFTTGLYWISSAFLVDSQVWGPLWGIPATLALAGGLALFFGFGAALAMTLWVRDMRRIAVFAAALFIAEWLRGNILSGLPWLLPGYIWTPGEPVSQLASVFGIYGLSLLTLLVSGAPAALADGHAGAAQRFAPSIAAALVIGMSWGWGAERIAHAPVDAPGALPLVRVADSGLSQQEKWCEYPAQDEQMACTRQQEWRVLQRYLAVSGPAEDSRTDILVWPEGAIPTLNFFALDNPAFMSAIGRGLGDRALVMGVTRCAPHAACDAFMQGRADVDSLRLYNSAAVIDGVSGVTRLGQIYDKHHLVPFGEYIPFWSVLRNLHIAPLQQIGAGFAEGPPPTRLILPGAPPAVVLICYEAIFPGMTPRGDERPGWIINISNDAWFGDPRLFSGPWQHFEIARYRTIEEGLPMARAASGGISAIVDSFGRIIRSTARRGGYAEAQLPPALVETTFARYGNIVLLLTLCLTLALRFLPPWRVSGDRQQ